MACKYFVNGDWVTENQLKELLQGGLLDTLISDGTLAIKGFKVDPDKVIKRDTVTIKRQSIPANKLANILAQEIKTRQGYSPNMLSALELKEDGSDFKIPLWASPYASKFESLLTSLVSNKVVKQKFPGGSYVLGSEEGFRIKEGDAAAGELKNSGIVFTENFDPEKGLQPMRWDPETKKILPAQIMLPFKFRDEDGNILPLKDFMIEGEDGRMILDTSKLPAKLLNLFGFRIPTQERNSMAAVEIVGFLPETSGDLLLAPRDFTKQMGSDFDVDKLYTYMYNYFYKDGKLQTGFMSDKKKIAASLKIQKEHLEDIKNELKLNKADRKLIDDYIKERIEFNENGDEVVSETATKASELISEILSKESNKELGKALDATFNTISILNRSYKAVRQNNILDIHLQIMTSTNPEIIASIIALDSFGEFEDLARDIDNARNGNKKMPNILSETYQRTKFINATAGKNGVGSFSLDSTFNSTAQGKEIVIQNLTEEAREQLFGTVLNPKPRPTSEEVLAANTPLATFGNVISRGDVSNKYTLRSQEIIKKAKLEKRELTPKETQSLKYKSSIIRALQSTAVDNEKAQILDKLNINDETFDVIRALSILGFEEQEIVGLITQEIIWEYVEKIRNSNSSLTPYNPNAAEDIFAELALKYDPSGTFAALDESRVELLSSKSAEDLMDNIKNKRLMRLQSGTTPDFNLEQLALLRKFQNLTATGKTIKVLQSTINTESSGIPKSLLETQGKIEQIERLPFLNVFNAEKLLGKYEEGKLSTPTTINGYAALYGAVFANEIFDKYFPYKSNGFELAVEEIVSHMPKRAELSTTKKAELQSEIFDAVKSYLYANSNTNLFGENPDVERRRLFIDSKQTATKPKNDSLATILQTLSEGANSKSWYQKNGFLNKLSFNLNKNGTISRINFEAAAGENFDETNIYDGFSYLLSKNFAVGNFNGIDYTSRMLAQELVAAAFLEGGTQGAKQYLKYVPVAYLKSLGFGEYLQGVPFDFQATFFGTLGENGLIYNRPSNFTRQYFQNNPEVTKTVRLTDLKTNDGKTPDYFTLNEDALSSNFVDSTNPVTGDATKEQTQFLSIYDSKLPTKYALYEFDSVERIYRRIPVLNGSFDFVSYNSESKNSLPIEAKEIITTPVPQQTAPGYSIPNIPVQPSKEFNVNVVNNTALPRTTADLPIDRNLANSKEALDDLLNILETSDEVSTLNRQLLQLIRGLELPENFKVTYDKTEGRGSYDSTKDKETLNINLGHIKNKEINSLATVVAHELIHALTSASIKAYQDGNIEGLSARTIAAIQQLENLQKLYIDQLVAKEGEEGLKKFKELYFNWKQGKTSIPSISKEDISKYYGAIKLTEFVTMALTDVGFQEHLNSITDESGISLWEQLKGLIANLLNTLGLDIKPGSALASAVKDTMDLIQANQETIRENNIETRQFLELGTTYRFQVDGSGKVVKGEYRQVGKMFEKLNAKTQQAKYDSLKASVETWKLFGDELGQPIQTQPSTSVEPVVNKKYEIFPGVFANAGQTTAIDKLKEFLESDEKAFLLEGKGGTGKTTIIKQILAQSGGKKILAIAPSHKAKKVLAKSLKGIDADIKTLASALAIKLDESTGKFEPDEYARKKGNVPIGNGQIIVIDESSMVSDALLSEIKQWVSAGAKVIFMGDRAQLPPVGQEKDSDVFGLKNSYTLTEKMRQAATSPIISIGTKIAANAENNTSRVANPITPTDRVDMFDAVSGSTITWESNENNALNEFVEDLQKAEGDVNFAKIVTFNNQNHNSPQSVKNLNAKVRFKLFGERARTDKFIPGEILTAYDSYNPTQGKEEVDVVFFNSDDMIIESVKFIANYGVSVEVFSGAKGRRSKSYNFDVEMLTLQNDDGKTITKNGRNVEIPVVAESSKEEYAATLKQLWAADRQLAYALQAKFGNLEYGYAITSHKAQGSTYTNVYVMEDNIMGSSNAGSNKAKSQSLYVAVSRPTTKLVMVSSKNNQDVSTKSTGLDLSKLSGSITDYQSMPTSNYGEESDRMRNRPSDDDWEAYNRAMNTNELLPDSTINSEEFRNYLLICGK
jgi:exodeoxyribonuclease-5